jgi:CDP-6-deoxy-D-xylo-4-hexulose-3-dehydrase
MVNSGASANELTMMALKYIYGKGEVIVPPLTWISDVASVLFAGLDPVFCDINLKNLSFDIEKLKSVITDNTKAIFITHVLGINAITDELLQLCKEKNILLIEDVCESHGASFKGDKCGSIGFASNFSFYFAHHMSTIEGGMICTNDERFYEVCRALRSHGMIREMTNEAMKQEIIDANPELNKDFIFLQPSHNFRSTELNAVIGLSQIGKLDSNNEKRRFNFEYFIKKLDSNIYHTDFELEGQSNYAFIVILKNKSIEARNHLENKLRLNGIEFRRGLSGGGNQLKQPYFKDANVDHSKFPVVNHVHSYSWYVGNYPSLTPEKIDFAVSVLNTCFNDFS